MNIYIYIYIYIYKNFGWWWPCPLKGLRTYIKKDTLGQVVVQ